MVSKLYEVNDPTETEVREQDFTIRSVGVIHKRDYFYTKKVPVKKTFTISGLQARMKVEDSRFYHNDQAKSGNHLFQIRCLTETQELARHSYDYWTEKEELARFTIESFPRDIESKTYPIKIQVKTQVKRLFRITCLEDVRNDPFLNPRTRRIHQERLQLNRLARMFYYQSPYYSGTPFQNPNYHLVNWKSRDMNRFDKWFKEWWNSEHRQPIAHTRIPFGSCIFDKGESDTIHYSQSGSPDLFRIHYQPNDSCSKSLAVGFPIIKRVSQRGYMVEIKGHTLEEIAMNPGGLRYLDKMVAEMPELFEIHGKEKTYPHEGKPPEVTPEELRLFRILGGRKGKKVNAYKWRSMPLYDDLGMRIKLYHHWLCCQGRYDTAAVRNTTVKEPDHSQRGVFITKTSTWSEPIVNWDDYADIDRRKMNPTADNMDDGPTHSLGTPTWIKAAGSRPEYPTDYIRFSVEMAVKKRIELFRQHKAIKSWKDTRDGEGTPMVKQLIMKDGRWQYAIVPWNDDQIRRTVALRVEAKHSEECHDYNKRAKGQEEWALPEWAGSWEQDEKPPEWPSDARRQLTTAWSRAKRVAELYERVGRLSVTELTNRDYSSRVRDKSDACDAPIIGTSADGFIIAGPESREYHEYLLKEADRAYKLELAEWESVETHVASHKPLYRMTGKLHPAVKKGEETRHIASVLKTRKPVMATVRVLTANDFAIQARNQALERLKELRHYNASMEQEVAEQSPELEQLVEKASTKDKGPKILKRLLTMRIKLRSYHLARYNRRCKQLQSMCQAGQITDKQLMLRRKAVARRELEPLGLLRK